MVGIGRLRALAIGVEHEGIGDDVGQGMHRIRNQCLGMGDPADDELHRGQHQIDHDTDPGNAAAFDVTGMGFAAHGVTIYSSF